jgi:hypothetical protein
MPLEDLAASLSAERGRGVLLIDTLDLILARETLPALRAIFTGLLDCRVTVFLTCRDYEYATLLDPVRDSFPGLADAVDRHQLPGFSAAEVEEATRSFFGSRTDLAVRDGGRALPGASSNLPPTAGRWRRSRAIRCFSPCSASSSGASSTCRRISR